MSVSELNLVCCGNISALEQEVRFWPSFITGLERIRVR